MLAASRSIARPQSAQPLGLALLALVLLGLGACADLYPRWIGRFFGPPSVELKEAYAAEEQGAAFDHAALDALLKEFVDGAGYVDYAGLDAQSNRLDAYIASLAAAPFGRLGRDEKLAFLINAYNAFTLRLILDYWGGGALKSIQDIPAERRWDDVRWNVGGNVWSLNQIEHEQIRPKFAEPRIHFALVCAATSCPPLRTEAYTGARLEEQLEAQAVYAHAHDRWFRYDPGVKVVRLTMLYNPSWYGGDFDQVAGSALNFAARYSTALRTDLDAGARPRIDWIPYSWDLNRQSPSE